MTSSTWQTYQTRLVAFLGESPAPARRWLLVRHAIGGALGPQNVGCDDPEHNWVPLVRLPGIWRPEGAPLQVRSQ